MNKTKLIENIAEMTDVSKAEATRFVDSFTVVVSNALKRGEEVKILDFGTFVKIRRKARNGRNPQTGKAIKLPARWSPKFRAHELLKNMLN